MVCVRSSDWYFATAFVTTHRDWFCHWILSGIRDWYRDVLGDW
jgi:hypothetical protein